MSLATLKILSGLTIVGGAVGISTHLYNKQPITESKTPSSRGFTAQDRQFYNCLDANNQVKVTEKEGEKRTFVVALKDAAQYVNNDKYITSSTYDGQCKGHNS